jgi:hypothetical protein
MKTKEPRSRPTTTSFSVVLKAAVISLASDSSRAAIALA